jgi:hypothetical protein
VSLWEVARTRSPHPTPVFLCRNKLKLGSSLLPPDEDMHIRIPKHDPLCKAFRLFVSRYQIDRQLKSATCGSCELSFQVSKFEAKKSKLERTKRRVPSSCDGSHMSSPLCWLLFLEWWLYFQHIVPYHYTTRIWGPGKLTYITGTCPM